ncbi:hypothetical protein KDA_07860 [Dictyobacter alpinus]|uniref:Uncharacterized protein n=1 Tax=Dictyobacter alpinus TaxID=2014873 RepID=A0A402B1R9_9CHLR|nr:hypothetical protein [Dictyobacter alpinus]GCE25302.1 hypothetical protein KDA_07860 [Dictyobacter alpinus]
MGIYLGQLPPAEIARLKAELAETLIANFCYPRFFDHRTESLQMRPVDRAKRQEVWLYLSSVDFTAWSRIDLTTPDFQHQIERLFIQFVQRNRNFFGNQGRRRMSDIRLLISACASTVAQNLRNHLTGQKPAAGSLPFGTPRPVVSWSASSISGRAEPTWEQIASSTLALQQQLQEIRGEGKSAPVAPAAQQSQAPTPVGAGASSANHYGSNGAIRRVTPTAAPTSAPHQKETAIPATQRPAAAAPAATSRPAQPVAPAADGRKTAAPAATAAAVASPPAARTGRPAEAEPKAAPRKLDSLSQPYDGKVATPTNRSSQSTATPLAPPPVAPGAPAQAAPASSPAWQNGTNGTRPPTSPLGDTSPAAVATKQASQAAAVNVGRDLSATTSPVSSSNSMATTTANGARDMMSVGEDDVAIFEQMRHQLVIWLRVEAISAGLEINSQSPTQLLEMLRQQARFDETRLQVVSTLLNLANQVIKTGMVTVLDYKQALMFHLMHTRRQ